MLFQGDLVLQCDYLYEALTKLSVIADKQSCIKVAQGRYRICIIHSNILILVNYLMYCGNVSLCFQCAIWHSAWQRGVCWLQKWSRVHDLQSKEWSLNGGEFGVNLTILCKQKHDKLLQIAFVFLPFLGINKIQIKINLNWDYGAPRSLRDANLKQTAMFALL